MKQVFQTDSNSRWKHFVWSIRVFIFLVVLLFAVFIVMMVVEAAPDMPFSENFRSAVSASRPYLRDNKQSKAYESFRKDILEDHARIDSMSYRRNTKVQYRWFEHGSYSNAVKAKVSAWGASPSGIRSAFYVNWDPYSYLSLKENINRFNLVMPEWLFINPKSGGIEVRIDHKALEVMRKASTPVMPMLTNNYNGVFNSATIATILHDGKRQKALIDSIVAMCRQNYFVGINLDFEEIPENSNEYLTAFVRRLSGALHANGLYLTQDITAFNEDYDVPALARYVDYLFLMAYDQHSSVTEAGPISSQKWVEAAIDDVAKNVPNGKIVLGLAAYGYDWTPKGDNNQTVSYRDALSLASDTQAKINFDGNTANLSLFYQDDDGCDHSVYFNDAATSFNLMRLGLEEEVAGFCVWRLGTEDSRMWQFYDSDMTRRGVKRFPLSSLETLHGSSNVNYLGSGEVLDVIKTPEPGHADIDFDDEDQIIENEQYIKIPTSYQLGKFGHAGPKELLLTFDDGPDARWTPKVLDILKQYHVKAAFFMVGLQIEKNLPIVRKVYDSGCLIGNHTFTHKNVAENSPERTALELKLTRMLIECITGNSTVLFRAPYNADSDPTGRDEIVPIVQARKANYLDVGEAIDPEDWYPGVTADQIYSRVVSGVEKGNGHIILLHDAGGVTRKETVKALPRIIEHFQKLGYRFITLDKYLGKTKAQLMPPIPKGKEYYAMQTNLLLVTLIYNIGNFITALFIVFIVLGFLRLAFMFWLSMKQRRKEKRQHLSSVPLPHDAPLVSIIVPAYNEEVNAVSSLTNLLEQDYPNYNIVFVDDGSKDNTYANVTKAFEGDKRLLILTKPNGGKASALNFGIAHTTADYVVCIDADTKLKHDAVTMLMKHFIADKDGRVAAVAGNVKVGNVRNLLTSWQSIEYISSQNFDRQAYAAINAITVVPGAVGAFRRSALQAVGGLSTDTLAEDCDLTISLLEAGFVVENENNAVALTEAPEHVKEFMKQRTRWSFGVMQTFWKHRGQLLQPKYKGLGLWALPNMLLFQFLIPTFSPIADVLMFFGIFSGNVFNIFIYYLIFTLIDASVSIMAFIYEREPLGRLLLIFSQRFFYRWIMYVVLFRSYFKAIKGELQQWGVLKRTGNVASV